MTLPPSDSVTAPEGNVLQSSAAVTAAAESSAPKKEIDEEWEQELLRDPFWPVGFYPPNWQRKMESQSGADLGGSDWKAAAAKLQISGTSRLGDRTAAVINGALKSEGEKVEALHEGKVYQWEIVGIDAAGQIQLKKIGIR